MGLEHSKEPGADGSPADCMTCATTAGEDFGGCFVSRRSQQSRSETGARDTLHTPRYHGAQGVITVSPTLPTNKQHQPYIPEYNMEGDGILAPSSHWNSGNGPPSARDISSSRPRVPSATFVGQHNEAKLVFPPQVAEMTPETAAMITPRRLVPATNTPRTYTDKLTPGGITPRVASANSSTHWGAAAGAVDQYSQLGARVKPAGAVPSGPSDAGEGHTGSIGDGSLANAARSSHMASVTDGPIVARTPSLNLSGLSGSNTVLQTPVSPDQPQSSRRSESPRQYVATKGGWIQTSVTISDMNIANWSQQKQDMFIEAVSATAQVPLSDVCVLSLKEKCGRRLLSIATEITFQVKAQTRDHATDIVRELKSQTLDAMMMQANIRIRPDTARSIEDSALLNPRSEVNGGPFNTPFRNGYSLSSSYKSQFGGETREVAVEGGVAVPPERTSPHPAPSQLPAMAPPPALSPGASEVGSEPAGVPGGSRVPVPAASLAGSGAASAGPGLTVRASTAAAAAPQAPAAAAAAPGGEGRKTQGTMLL